MLTTVSSLQTSGEASDLDRLMMARALELAAKGVGLVSPGPLVGCVIVSADGSVVGEGFYVYEEIKHAETLALEQAGTKAAGATAYVSLEPHAHHGRTPPCTERINFGGHPARRCSDRRSKSQSFRKRFCNICGQPGWKLSAD